MDLTLKFFQIIFYITASVITVLTFIKAKNGLLNSVNTEYQKRVMDRLASLSNELYDEFDPDSESYWAKNDWVKEVVEPTFRTLSLRIGIYQNISVTKQL